VTPQTNPDPRERVYDLAASAFQWARVGLHRIFYPWRGKDAPPHLKLMQEAWTRVPPSR